MTVDCRATETTYGHRVVPLLENTLRDAGLAFRAMRSRPGLVLTAAQAQVSTIAQNLAAQFPGARRPSNRARRCGGSDEIWLMMVSMTAADFRKIALSLPDAIEGSHHGNADFRVGGKIFATLAYEKEGFGVVMVSPEEQQGMMADAPEMFLPVVGAWGRNGATRVRLAKVTPEVLKGALQSAWKRRAPKRAL